MILRTFFFCLAVMVVHTLSAQRTETLFDDNWKFSKGDVAGAEESGYNDSGWRNIHLPHDWSIEDLPNSSDTLKGPFSKASIGATATGYTIGGTAWYRKHFALNSTAGRQVSILFDGVYMNSDVWVNGHWLGNHPYGYTSFYYNITPYLTISGGPNVIAVRVRNEGRNSRWYSGSGIYRHVYLISTGATHFSQWGVAISTPDVSSAKATVRISAHVNKRSNGAPFLIKTNVTDAAGKMVTSVQQADNNNSNSIGEVTIAMPHLWSPESPYLYTATTELWQDNKVVDKVKNTFGVRSVRLNADSGFLLNGKKVLLRGGCVHHDNGALGSATPDRAEERRIALLKSFGFNAIRTSHNPPSKQFLDACDKLGMLVIDEAFDQWQRAKNPQDYHLYFDTCWQRDIDAMVLRDRNHPSVVFWSIGNEINERADSSGLRIAKALRNEVKSLDNTRPVTEAICAFWDHPGYRWDTTANAFALLDAGGYNYTWKEYGSDHAKYPQRLMMGTESVPSEAYDNWQQVEEHPYVIGDFVWTAMDYLGETGIGHTSLDSNTEFAKQWPWFNSWCGDIDLIGGKKAQSYYRDVVWRRSKLEMLVHSPLPDGHKEAISYWGWPEEHAYYTFTGSEGKPLQVHVYTQYPSVRLQLNGKEIGEQAVSPESKLTATFSITYIPGRLVAYGVADGKVVDSVVLQTAGAPASIQLVADRKQLESDIDLSYITATVVDKDGNRVPDKDIALHFTTKGNGNVIATASANPAAPSSFQQPVHTTFEGRCLAIVQPKGAKGNIIVKAEGAGLKTAELNLTVK